ncbi:MAG: FecR domain-containing protein [Rhodocyclaceae bacterium]|nr:FecR domain-containing protein [Rhodocyclaceae bacterium]
MNATLPRLPVALATSLACLFAPLPASAADAVVHYTIQRGDTLIHLAQRHLLREGDWVRLQRDNAIADPRRLRPGSRLRVPVRLLRQAPAALTVEAVHGPVLWRAGEGEWAPAKGGDRLDAGATVKTGADASALLRLADDTRILISPESAVVLDGLRQYGTGMMVYSRLRLDQGQAEIDANPGQRPNVNLRIDTPGAQTVVRGTRFRVGTDGAATREETLQGAVTVTAGGRGVSVEQGKGTVARTGEPPMPPTALLPAADTAGLPTRFERLPMRFPVPQLQDAEAWLGQISPDEDFRRILLERSTAKGPLVFADLPNGDYVLRLRGADRFGLQGHDALHRFTVFARPFAPGINAPGDGGTVRTARPRFEWTHAVDVSGYRLQVAEREDFAAPLHDAGAGGTEWTPAADLPAGRLYWRIASIDGSGRQGPWSTAAAFTYKPGPGPVDAGRISTQLRDDALQLELGPPPAELRYAVVLSGRPDLGEPLAEVRADDGSIRLPRPEGGTYYLGIGFEDIADGTPGPKSVSKIDVPHPFPWPALLILLLPLL